MSQELLLPFLIIPDQTVVYSWWRTSHPSIRVAHWPSWA